MSLSHHLWAIILAGGEGTRLRPLARVICGDERPKQYVPLLGPRSLLRQTLDRAARLVPTERTVVVAHRRHAAYLAAEFTGSPAPTTLLQPEDRGTAAGVLYPAHWILRRDPAATVAVFPSDHFIGEEGVFLGCVAEAAWAASRDPRWIVLLGALPTGPDPDYGWIEPGAPLAGAGGDGLYEVVRFWEKPTVETAEACLRRGCLWNTLVFAASAELLVTAGQRTLPELHERLSRLGAFAGTQHERWATQQAFALAPRADFSSSVLEPAPSLLAVQRLPHLTWCDLGTPERVLRAVREAGMRLPWLGAFERAG